LQYADTKTFVVPKIYLYSKRNTLVCAGMTINWENGVIVECGRDQDDNGKFDKNRYVSTFTGCCFLIHKNILKKVGTMSEDYFLYFEDHDYAERLLEKNIKIMYCYKSVIWHKESVSTNKSGVKNYYFLRNRFLLFYKFRHKCPARVWINNLFEFIFFILIGGKNVYRLLFKDITSILGK
jgi:GT2 family glycosyltransferase